MSASKVRLSVGVKMTVATVFLIGVVIAGYAFLASRALTQMSEAESASRREMGRQLVDRLSAALVSKTALSMRTALLDTNYSLAKELVDSTAKEDPDIAFVQVLDDGGKVIADSRGVKDKDDRPEVTKRLAGTKNETVTIDEGAGAALRVFGVRMVTGEQALGQLRLGYSMARFNRDMEKARELGQARAAETRVNMMVVAAALLLLGLGMALFQSRRISRPIRELSRQASLISAGDLGHRVEIKSNDEIGALSADFNHMADRIAALLVETREKAAIEKELEVARVIQETLVPSSDLVRAGPLELCGHFQPASVCGGDWWTYTTRPDGKVMVVIGDVTGHGIPAALITAAAVGCVESINALASTLSPDRLLGVLNRAIYVAGRRNELAMTCHVSVFDPRSGMLEYANAAHNFPYYLSPKGENGHFGVLASRGNRLGDKLDSQFTMQTLQLTPGDTIVWYTDGVYECLNPSDEVWGDKRFRNSIRKGIEAVAGQGADARAMRDSMLNDMFRFTQQRALIDDVTLVVGRFMPR